MNQFNTHEKGITFPKYIYLLLHHLKNKFLLCNSVNTIGTEWKKNLGKFRKYDNENSIMNLIPLHIHICGPSGNNEIMQISKSPVIS